MLYVGIFVFFFSSRLAETNSPYRYMDEEEHILECRGGAVSCPLGPTLTKNMGTRLFSMKFFLWSCLYLQDAAITALHIFNSLA
jgi:hypothetical protein